MTSSNETVQNNTPLYEKEQKNKAAGSTAVSPVRRRAEKIFGGQSSDIAKLLTLAAAGLSAVFDEPATAAAVMVLITAEAAAGLIRERSCISASEKIAKASEPAVRIRTEDGTRLIPSSELREGDIFEIGEGGIFPCDSIIIEQQELACDESALTGNSSPAEKTAYAGEEIRDRLGLRYIGYSGSVVVRGQAVCKAKGHGSEVFRKEPRERVRTSGLVTECRRRAERIFTAVCSVSSAMIAAAGIIRGGGITQSLSLGIAAAAVCIPERLTAAAELSSARIRRLLFRKGITVKDTAALERLGDTELILADLRGTVTGRQRSVRKLYIPADDNAEYDYSELTGRLTFGRDADGYMAWENSALGETMICAAVCCKARRTRHGEATARNRRTCYEGDSDDAALLALCSACGIDRDLLLLSKIEEKTDSPAARCISFTCRVLGGEIRIYSKGTPEAILGICGGVYGTDSPEALIRAYRKAAEMAEDGLGVTAFCETTGGRTQLLGLAGLYSAIPPGAAEAIRALRRMSVRTMMFTDDERATAKAAAYSAGILTDGKRCCTGAELDAMTDEQFEAVSGAVTVFAQAEPRHKGRIVSIAEDMKLSCAAAVSGAEEAKMLSDTGALLFACETLPDSVKQSAEVIVPQGCLEELSGAVRCGRALYGALRGRACAGIEFAVSVMIMLLTASATGMSTPILPVQLLLSSILTGPAAAETMAVIPSRERHSGTGFPSDDHFIGRRLFSLHFMRGFVTAFTLLGCFTILLRTVSPASARTGVTAALSLSRLFTAARSFSPSKLPARAAAVILLSAALTAAAISLPLCEKVFCFSPLSPVGLIITVISAVLPTVLFSAARLFRSKVY